MFAVFTDIVQVVMFKATKSAGVKVNENDYYLCITHAIGFTTVFYTIIRGTKCCFSCFASKNLQNSSAKQKISVTLSSENIAIRVCYCFI